jgi:hypothetical protein
MFRDVSNTRFLAREFALPRVLASGDPDPERAQARETSPPRPRKAYLTAA